MADNPCPGIVRPVVTLIEGVPNPARTLAVRVVQGQTAAIEWTMRDDVGLPVALDACETSSSLSSSGSSWSSASAAVKVRLREALNESPLGGWKVDGSVQDVTCGLVRFTLPAVAVEWPGVLAGEIGVFRGDELIFSNQFYIIVDRGQFGAAYRRRGPPSIAEIRSQLRDTSPEDNYLLRVVEWDLGEVAMAIIAAVETFNSTTPYIRAAHFNTSNFFDPRGLMKGIVAYLYDAAASNYLRNSLPYSAAGVTVDDKNKFGDYRTYATQMKQDYITWVGSHKIRINASMAYGSVGGWAPGARW